MTQFQAIHYGDDEKDGIDLESMPEYFKCSNCGCMVDEAESIEIGDDVYCSDCGFNIT